MIQLELFPENIPDTPVSDQRFWQWLDLLAGDKRGEISISLIRPRVSTRRRPAPAAIVADVASRTVHLRLER